jgi:hypothetical protein
MDKMTDIQKKVDEAMDSILNITRATPGPFFYTRLEARIIREESGTWERVSRLVSKPAFAILTVSAILIMNTFVILNGTPEQGPRSDLSEVATADDLGANSFYDIENVQP